MSSRREQNLLLVAQFEVRWPPSDELRRALRELRTSYPAGSAVMNLVANREGTGLRTPWSRLSTMFLAEAANRREAGHADLGTAHLFEPVGWRSVPMRLIFRLLERHGRDFPKYGNKIVSSVEEAADWLAVRLADGPVTWNREELRDTIASFVRDNPLPVAPSLLARH